MATPSKKALRPAMKVESAPVAVRAPHVPSFLEPEAAEAPPPAEVEPSPVFAALDAETVEAAAPEQPEIGAVEPPKAAAADQHATAGTLQHNLLALLEKSVVESRAKYAEARTAAEAAGAAVEASYGAARQGAVAFNLRAIEAIKSETDANFDHLASLASARSVSDAVTLQTEFTRKWLEGSTARAKEFAALARKVADDAAAPIRAHVAKAFNVGP